MTDRIRRIQVALTMARCGVPTPEIAKALGIAPERAAAIAAIREMRPKPLRKGHVAAAMVLAFALYSGSLWMVYRHAPIPTYAEAVR